MTKKETLELAVLKSRLEMLQEQVKHYQLLLEKALSSPERGMVSSQAVSKLFSDLQTPAPKTTAEVAFEAMAKQRADEYKFWFDGEGFSVTVPDGMVEDDNTEIINGPS